MTNATLRLKFLFLLARKNRNKGFTLIELLVVIIIIGILSAIALPAFLNQVNRARQSEAKTYVGAMNRAQQAYRLENPTFANNLANLSLGIRSSTSYYSYFISDANVGGSLQIGMVKAELSLKAYIGLVQFVQALGQDASSQSIICEARQSNTPVAGTAPTTADVSNENLSTVVDDSNPIACGSNFRPMN
ncbi:type IV pilin-like G/H family protein [Leptolyngbya sp. FACHB-261]|uniref:type IV pilin-like G/H family protein n=1 Tax=Leptolyngbya sp. FACHB-261 TaxID=2692806 RepID=UPI001689E6ED|nr:type IV pilin-like G/H family protein [Leptolyngbya sp. FACHB-261]MBD2100106.1 type IV pilin-like G/H family protein [Leptolyngbya sp. FACHB-261]